jgi:hypothetical protein
MSSRGALQPVYDDLATDSATAAPKIKQENGRKGEFQNTKNAEDTRSTKRECIRRLAVALANRLSLSGVLRDLRGP